MRRLNLAYFSQLGTAIAPLCAVPDPDKFDSHQFRRDLFRASAALKILLDDEGVPLAIPASKPVARSLLNQIDALSKRPAHKVQDAWDVLWDAEKVQTLLDGELAVQSVYHIWPKRAYDTNLLIEQATRIFSADIRKWLTQEECYNVEQAGKCLAFEVPTAAAFHLMRAAESTIRRYYAIVIGKLPKPKARNWGVYINNLKAAGADQKIMFALEQVKELHRNPVIHPEAQVSLDEALSLLGLIDSVITAIYTDMKRREEAASPALPVQPQGILAATLLGLAQAANTQEKDEAAF